MATESNSVATFTAGVVDRTARSRVNVRRLVLGAETQTNWMSHVLGYMSLRPGLRYLGLVSGVIPTRGTGTASIVVEPTGVGAEAAGVDDTLYRVPYASFAPVAGEITFEDKSDGDTNPVYAPADYGASAPSPTVSFGGSLAGQTLTTLFDPDGEGFLTGSPTLPLAVANNAQVWTDPSRPVGETKVLAANSSFAGPYVMLFSDDVVGAGFSLGGLNTAASCRVRVYDRNGVLLMSEVSTSSGLPTFEDFYFRRGSDNPIIAAITIEVGGGGLGAQPVETSGAGIDNVEFTHTGIPGGPP